MSYFDGPCDSNKTWCYQGSPYPNFILIIMYILHLPGMYIVCVGQINEILIK